MDPQAAQFDEIRLLEEKLTSTQIPPELHKKAKALIDRLLRISQSASFSQEYDSVSRYLDWVMSIPWNKKSPDNLSLENAKKVLDSNHYGLDKIKERILEYIAVVNLKANQQVSSQKAPALLFLGLVGTGKTTMAYSIAEALGRKFGRIPMGGMGDALQLRGKSRSYPDSEPGQIVKVLRRVGTKNPVILLDEIDRVTDEAKADIMGVLVELLDPEQNNNFLDHFIDFPIDLSEVLFIATANNTAGIATAVIDRLEVMEMPSYTDKEKIIIGKNYLLQKAITSTGLKTDDIHFDEDVWSQIVRPLGFDAGMRTLDRTINGICRKIAKLKLEGKITSIQLTGANLKEYLPTW
ncbi:MAG: AAA family ATPase [Candidatus Curtissbacteria bacterium]|nr:AAA family ATPase [Candidatus Curtissbacteria bacterium]